MADAPQAPLNARTNHIFMQIHAINGVISSDQTGCFPITSNRGNAYVGIQMRKLPIPVRGSAVPVLVPVLVQAAPYPIIH